MKNKLEAINRDQMIQRNGAAKQKTEQWKSLSLNRKKKKRIFKNKDSARDLQGNIKCTIIFICGVSEEEREKGQKTTLKK